MTKNQPTTEELLHSQILLLEALVRILDKKDIVKKEEIQAEVAKLKQEMEATRKKN